MPQPSASKTHPDHLPADVHRSNDHDVLLDEDEDDDLTVAEAIVAAEELNLYGIDAIDDEDEEHFGLDELLGDTDADEFDD